MTRIYHVNNGGTNLTSNQIAGVTTTPVNAVPSISVPFYAAFDATNANGHYEEVLITGKTSTNLNHAATAYAHTTAEEVRFPFVATEADAISAELFGASSPILSGWNAYSTVTPTRASADDPTYVLTFSGVDLTSTMSVGMKVKWTQNSTVRYGIITAISFSTNTTLTLYGGTDYDVDDTATYAISAFHYSTQKAPLSFPLDPSKWSVSIKTNASGSQASPTTGTWYNLGGSLVIPIGSWDVMYSVFGYWYKSSAGYQGLKTTLSTANNSESDAELTCFVGQSAVTGDWGANGVQQKTITIASKTTFYLNAMSPHASQTSIALNDKRIIEAVCAYL